ncbi:MAG: hypothetical protein IT373_20830 [Polyangiaceae bacterium]|nr:hypothetical protein [Polyangiaceae bacterium]
MLADERGHLVAAEGQLWRYFASAGLWRLVDRDEQRRTVKGFAGAPKGSEGILKVSSSAVEGAIALASAEVAEAKFFADAAPGVAFANGFAAIVNGDVVLRQHDHAHRARAGHEFAYATGADREPLLSFLAELFADCESAEREARIAFMQEHVGACLAGIAPTYQRSALWLGPGGNGKSTAEQILYRGALPDGTTVSLAPQLWGERFQAARMIGALANVVDELPEAELIKTGAFKAIVSGEPVHVELKHRDAFEARLRCGHVFSANALPGTADLTEGFFRRFVIVRFDRRFDNTPGCRPELAREVVTACRPGIAAWALDGAARLVRQGRYTIPPGSETAIAEWRKTCDSVALFADERTRPAKDASEDTRASDLYTSYAEWARANGLRAVSSRTFAQRLEARGTFGVHRNAGTFYPVRLRHAGEQ